jgi:hypothetical protein
VNGGPLSQLHVLEVSTTGKSSVTICDRKLFLKWTWFGYVNECGVEYSINVGGLTILIYCG